MSVMTFKEITVDEDLLVPVLQELLAMAVNPNQVTVVHGKTGRVILAEAHLADHWYQERMAQHKVVATGTTEASSVSSEAAGSATTPAPMPAVVATPKIESTTIASRNTSEPSGVKPASQKRASSNIEASKSVSSTTSTSANL